MKFLLRAESPRDYMDILRSFQHIPTVNIIDIAHSVAKLAKKIQPNMFSNHDGRLAHPTDELISAAEKKELIVDIPALGDDRPADTQEEGAHPVTGLRDRYLLFDWFHQENSKVKEEVLRRASLVRQLAGTTNTQAAEQFNRNKERDIYWLNEMNPTNHLFFQTYHPFSKRND